MIRKTTSVLTLLILTLSGSALSLKTEFDNSAGEDSSTAFPLKKGGPMNRYIVDGNNVPFLWVGDAAWSAIAQLNRQEMDLYLDNRKAKGFSVLLVSLLEHKFATNAPANIYNELPFTGSLFTSPNEKYFEHADYFIRAAGQRGIVVLLAPLYLGYGCGDEGWCHDVRTASSADLYSWGLYVGKRYRDFGNIVWIIGGDTDPRQVNEKMLEMVRGIRENDPNHLLSAHNQPETMAITPWTDQSWLTVNNVYSYDTVLYTHLKKAYDFTPVMPYYFCESAYENEHGSTPQQLRSQAYQALLSGAVGHIFGNCPVWHFGAFESWCKITNWKEELNNAGSVGMDIFQRLFRSRPWSMLVPDFAHNVLVGGYGTFGTRDYVTSAITSDANTFIAYLPSRGRVTVDMGKISGERAKCWLYCPATGSVTLIGIYRAAGRKEFATVSEGDQVLVIDNLDANLPVPGTKGTFCEF